MLKYISKRLLMTIPMLIGITLLTQGIIALTPGGPAAGLMSDFNPKISPKLLEQRIKDNNFDKPFIVRYAMWLKKAVRLDFGKSDKDNRPVFGKIAERVCPTLLLTTSSLILVFLLAVPLGIYSALKHNSWIDRAMTVFVFIGFSLPTYWIALLLMIGMGIHLGWLPITGYRSILSDDMGWFAQRMDIAKHLVLPLIVTALTGLASLSRYVRNGMLEVIRQDYIRTARAKGLPESIVIGRHALRNILIPIVTILGFSLPELFSAGVIFETIFSYPGLGRLMYEAAMSRDMNLVMGTTVFISFLTLLGNLLADVSYGLVDPRIRHR